MKRRKQTELSHPNFVAVRLSDTEMAILDQVCASLGTTRSEYLRRLLTEKEICNNIEIVADIKLLRDLVGQYGKIGSNLNQIAKYFNTGGTHSQAIEYYGAAEPPVRCGESHLSGLTEPPHFVY